MITQSASFNFAETLFQRGTDFLPHGLVAEALNISFHSWHNILFSEKELVSAKERGYQLIWFPPKDMDGDPITMKRLYESFRNNAPLGGRLLSEASLYLYQNEPFFTEEISRGSWRLVSTKPVPGTKGKNYLEQTIIAADYVTNIVYGGNPPDNLKYILAEPRACQDEISKFMNDENWQKATESLSNLNFNLMFRDTPVEAMIRAIVNQKINKIRILGNEYSWTNARSRSGRMVGFGKDSSIGAVVSDRYPNDLRDNMGFFLSQSAVVWNASGNYVP